MSRWLPLASVALLALGSGETPASRSGDGGGDASSDQGSNAPDTTAADSSLSGSDGRPADQASAPADQASAPADQASPPPPDQASPPPPDQGNPPPPTELLLFDQQGLQFAAADKGFDPLINPGDPLPASNWLSPHDYYDGELRIRYVIEGPPGQVGGKLQVCIWTMPGYSPESCASQVAHTGVGEYFETKLAPSSWWKKDNQPLDFSHPENFLIRVVLRGESGCNVTSYTVSNGCWDEWPKYEQMKYGVTIVMVPKGSTFSGWSSYP